MDEATDRTRKVPPLRFDVGAGSGVAVAGFLIALAVLISRMPEALTAPTLWAEDGAVFLADAFNLGVGASLFEIYRGSLHAAQRIVASGSLVLPLEAIPHFFALVALLVPAGTAALLLSLRFEPAIPDVRVRALLAFLVVGLPYDAELHASLTNLQWHLALLACLVILAAPGRGFVKRCDYTIVGLASFTGPFGFPLLGVSALDWLLYRQRRALAFAGVAAAGALVQGVLLLTTGEVADGVATQATPGIFVRIVVEQVLLGGLVGARLTQALPGSTGVGALTALVFVGGGTLLAVAAARGSRELRLLLAFGAAILAMALAAPTTTWSVLERAESAGRYWLIPTLAYVAALVWGVPRGRPGFVRVIAVSGLLLLLPGIAVGWRHPPRVGPSLSRTAAALEGARAGTTLVIPISPDGWMMELTKR